MVVVSLREANFYLNHLAIPDVAISIGFRVVVPVVVPIIRPVRLLVLVGIPVRVAVVTTVSSQELCCNRLNQQDEKES